MHCTAHICNRTEWLQDFIALILCYQKKKKVKEKRENEKKSKNNNGEKNRNGSSSDTGG